MTRVLFGENVCKNERIGSHRGWCVPGTPPRSANAKHMVPQRSKEYINFEKCP